MIQHQSIISSNTLIPYYIVYISGSVTVRMSSVANGSRPETVVEQVAAILPNHTEYVLVVEVEVEVVII